MDKLGEIRTSGDSDSEQVAQSARCKGTDANEVEGGAGGDLCWGAELGEAALVAGANGVEGIELDFVEDVVEDAVCVAVLGFDPVSPGKFQGEERVEGIDIG